MQTLPTSVAIAAVLSSLVAPYSTLAPRGALYATSSNPQADWDFLFGNLYHPQTNPDGIVNLGVAENAS